MLGYVAVVIVCLATQLEIYCNTCYADPAEAKSAAYAQLIVSLIVMFIGSIIVIKQGRDLKQMDQFIASLFVVNGKDRGSKE